MISKVVVTDMLKNCLRKPKNEVELIENMALEHKLQILYTEYTYLVNTANELQRLVTVKQEIIDQLTAERSESHGDSDH